MGAKAFLEGNFWERLFIFMNDINEMSYKNRLKQFMELREQVSPALKRLFVNYNGMNNYEDVEDYMQDILCLLWQMSNDDSGDDKSAGYYLKSAWFYMQNHRRTDSEPEFSSLDKPVYISNDETVEFKELLPEPELSREALDARYIVDSMLNNGLSSREKEVLRYLRNGYTVREIGDMLGVSHVMVVKIKASIRRKWLPKI